MNFQTQRNNNTERLISWLEDKMNELDIKFSVNWIDLVLWMKVQNNPNLKLRQTLIELADAKEFIQAYLCWEPDSERCPADRDSSHVPPWSSLFITTRPGSYDQEGIDFTAECFRGPLNWGKVLKALNDGLWLHSSAGALMDWDSKDSTVQEEWEAIRDDLREESWDFWNTPTYQLTPEVANALAQDPQPVV